MRRGTLSYVAKGPHMGAYGVVSAASFSEVILQSACGHLSVQPPCCVELPRGFPRGADQRYRVGAPERGSIPILDENRLEAARVHIDGLVNQDLAHQMAAAPLLLQLLGDLAEEAPDVCPTKRLAERVIDYLTRPRLPCPICTGAGKVQRDATEDCATCDGSGTIAGPTTPLLVPLPSPKVPPVAPGTRGLRIPTFSRFEQIGLKRLLVEGPKRGPALADFERTALVGLSMRTALVTHTDIQSPEGFLFALTPAGEAVARELLRRGERLKPSQVQLLRRIADAGDAGTVVPRSLAATARVLRDETVPRLVEFVPSDDPKSGTVTSPSKEEGPTTTRPQRLAEAGRAWLAKRGSAS